MEDGHSVSQSDESSEEDANWGINYITEKNIWIEKVLKYYCYKPEKCPTCFKGNFDLKENKGNNILNPFYLRCNNTKRRKRKLLRAYTFFNLHKNIHVSVLLEVFNLFIELRLNAKWILSQLSNKYKKNISYNTTCSILDNILKMYS